MSDDPTFSPSVISAADELTTRYPHHPFFEEQSLRTAMVIQEVVDGACEEARNEVASVLQMLDELAELWGDEGKFRACRDRLRKLVMQ